PDDARRYAASANQAAADARRYADEARTEVERSEMLLREAEEQLKRAEKARAHCAEVATQLKRRPQKVYTSRSKPKPAAKPAEPVATPQPTVPAYSPSDAP